MPIRVLIVDDDQALRLSIKASLDSAAKFEIAEAFDGVNALEKIKSEQFDLVLLDVDMPRMNGLSALQEIKQHNPGIIVIMMTAFATIQDAVTAVKDGAYDYLSKPVASEELINLIEKAVQAHSLISSVAASSPILMEGGRKIIGNTQQMQKVFNIIYRISKVDTPVLIRGASGTGKELAARALHFNSSRKDGKFVAINCSAIPENLLESELFGHEKGAFTGADQRKIGRFQFAEGGTLFLDEIGDMPVSMQVKLLRVLQEKVFTPVGSNREIPSNVRILAATNRPLEDMIKKGTFREDLFYRLNVIPIFLPSLVERKDDLESLVQMFVRKFNVSHGKKITGINADALAVLKRYDWPGNIRELENVIEHSFVMELSNKISLASLPESILKSTGTSLLDAASLIKDAWDSEEPLEVEETSTEELEESGELEALDLASGTALDFNAQKEAFEREFIVKALKAFKGRINQTALHANIPKKTLLRKIEKYGINAKDYSKDPC